MHRLLLLTLICSPGWACVCGERRSAKEAWLEYPLVFVGTVERTAPPAGSERSQWLEDFARVRVTEPFKGVKRDQVLELFGRQSSCFGGFPTGLTLLYLYPSEKQGYWAVSPCGRSSSVERAADDLKFLRGLPGSARGNRVSGTLEVWDEGSVDGFRFVRSVAKVRVRAVSARGSYETRTDADGLYEFRNLPPGTYTIEINYPKGVTLRFAVRSGKNDSSHEGRLITSEPARLEVTADSGNGIDFNLAPDTRISGRVLDPNGRPMKGVCIHLEPLQVSSRKFSRSSGCTNADGFYTIGDMAAGKYRVIANRDGIVTAAQPFGRLYYPGTPDVTKAQVVTATVSEHRTGIDLQVKELAPRIELQGRLTFSDGVPVPREAIRFYGQDGRVRQQGVTDSEGYFAIEILAGEPGALASRLSLSRGETNGCANFSANFDPNGKAVSVESAPYPVAADRPLSDIRVMFPFPSCGAWRQGGRGRP